MKKLLLALVAVASLVNMAMADLIRIATGKEGGGYDTAAKKLALRLNQRGEETIVTNYNGSDEISLAICGGKADMGYMQIDAVYSRALEGCDLKSVGFNGSEYAVILFPPKSKNDELSDLGPNDTILADTIGSGSDLWLRTAIKIEKSDAGSKDQWSNVKIANDPLSLAHASAEMGEISAVVMVRKLDSPDISRLIELGWTLGYLWDKNLDDLKFKNKSLYEGDKVSIIVNAVKMKNWAYSVSSFIMVSPKLVADRTLFGKITAVASE